MNDQLIPSPNITPPHHWGKILNIIIAILALLIITALIFGGWKLLSRKIKSVDLEQQRKEELLALDKQLAEVRKTDKDLDGLTDEQEKQFSTSPDRSDTDGDGILDKTEIEIWKTDPLKSDTDGDGHVDGYEVRRGFNPLGEGKIQYNK